MDDTPHTDAELAAFLDAAGSSADDGMPADWLGDVLTLAGDVTE